MTASNTYGRAVDVPMVNKSGGQVVLGDAVIYDTTNNDAFTTSTSTGSTLACGVAQETIASNGTGRIRTLGYTSLVTPTASVTRGHYGYIGSVAKQVTDAGASRAAGTFLYFLSGGTTPDAIIYPVDLAGAALTNPMTTAEDIIKGGSSGTPARLAVGAAGGALSVINSAVAWNSGTSFPGSKATGDRYWRTDLGLEGYWDGTRWLTTTLYTLDLVGPFDGQSTAAANGWPVASGNSPLNVGRKSIWHNDFALWLVELYGESFTNTTNNGSNFWTLSVSGAVTSTAYGSIDTSADTAATHTGHKATLNVAAGSTERAINTLLTKTGTPGTTYFPAMLSYRLILT